MFLSSVGEPPVQGQPWMQQPGEGSYAVSMYFHDMTSVCLHCSDPQPTSLQLIPAHCADSGKRFFCPCGQDTAMLVAARLQRSQDRSYREGRFWVGRFFTEHQAHSRRCAILGEGSLPARLQPAEACFRGIEGAQNYARKRTAPQQQAANHDGSLPMVAYL